MNRERDTDERLWHPWLRINRVLRVMLRTRWSTEAWPQVRAEFKKALRSQIRRAGWFNWPSFTRRTSLLQVVENTVHTILAGEDRRDLDVSSGRLMSAKADAGPGRRAPPSAPATRLAHRQHRQG